MAEQLEINLKLTNEKVQFTGSSRSNPAITCDYFPPIGDGEGYTGHDLESYYELPSYPVYVKHHAGIRRSNTS